MHHRLTRAALLATTCLPLLLTACSGSPAKLWPFGGDKAQDSFSAPSDATEYQCKGGKRFFVRQIDDGNAAWLILPERQVRLAKSTAGATYRAGNTVLDINGAEATLADGSANSFVGCKRPAAN